MGILLKPFMTVRMDFTSGGLQNDSDDKEKLIAVLQAGKKTCPVHYVYGRNGV
jgi:uncharacterized OsmC-like protein